MVALKNSRQYIVNYTLGQLEQLLNPSNFYRINRKTIANISSIKSMQMERNYKWMVQLQPEPDFKVAIPSEKLSQFKSWVCQ